MAAFAVTPAAWPYRKWVWLLLAALSLHNIEEALTYGPWRGRSAELLAKLTGQSIVMPSASAFQAALPAVTMLAVAAAIWAGRGATTPGKDRVVTVFAAILLINVFAPHLPAAILLGGYAPGVASAVLINLPLSVAILRRRP